MRSFLRGVVAGVVDELAWSYALPVLVVAAGVAVVIVPDARGLAIVVIGLLCLPIAIAAVTAYLGTLRARVRYERNLLEHDEGPDDDAGPE